MRQSVLAVRPDEPSDPSRDGRCAHTLGGPLPFPGNPTVAPTGRSQTGVLMAATRGPVTRHPCRQPVNRQAARAVSPSSTETSSERLQETGRPLARHHASTPSSAFKSTHSLLVPQAAILIHKYLGSETQNIR
ncbi:unnamed protein product [Rangifer tarandus platyrhynchus]|uniref:Uncharacterized protein n=2 Tax=Rangifer tarandus platyrhynchus TaxID=3082113 RepID=A0ABN8ZAS6_RANTA|nr:unnamed protein product [Rangifer tarandus platyrhynchus]CAI9704028.1 unnamed protein product [Rangifer tarandus platyrhynchus]